MTNRRKRLIEVAFPLEEVSAHSRREKSVRHGHISTLHIWWARRPLAACRAFIYASLVDDPETAAEREALLREVADLASWDAVRHPDRVVRPADEGGSGLTGTQLLERARGRILRCNGGEPPTLLDPFAGGGAIPLEGLRLGCDVEASDLNPVAVLILKGTLEYPQRFGQPDSRPVPAYIREAGARGAQSGFVEGDLVEEYRYNPLAADVRFWGNWVLERAVDELAEFYPPDPDGSVPVAYLWSRTIPCPSCRAEMPLIRQYWLARKPKKRVALEPIIDREAGRVDFEVVAGKDVLGSPEHATTSRGDTRCLVCGQVVKAAQVHEIGRAGDMDARMTAVVLAPNGRDGKRYRPVTEADMGVLRAARGRAQALISQELNDLPAIPDEPLAYHPQYMLVREYGLDQWGKLFNQRQLVALTTFTRLVAEARIAMHATGHDDEYVRAVTTYLGLAIDRLANQHSTLSRWHVGGEKLEGVFARQALPMVWDFTEGNPLSGHTGDFSGALRWIEQVIVHSSVAGNSSQVSGVSRKDAATERDRTDRVDIIVTDPPYYDAINYADLSDFFYVWMKRSIGSCHPELLSLPLTPKREQAVMNVYASRTSQRTEGRELARGHYVSSMASAFSAMARSLRVGGVSGVVFAHTDPDAWGTLIEGLLEAGLVPDASWPIDTEMETKSTGLGQARLRTSVWMACRKREGAAAEAFLGDVLEEMRPVIRERLLAFWREGIRGADFFISAIGPALSVFGRHLRVLRPDGSQVSVRDFLDIVRRESTTVALEQVLRGADLGVVDPITRQYVTWVWSYSRASLDSGEALALCLATGASFDDLTREQAIAVTARERSKKVVKLRTIAERAREDEGLGLGTPARPALLIDQLQRAAWLWGQNQGVRLGQYRGGLGESRWTALLTLGQAVAECLPDGDEDRRIILGLLGATVPGPSPSVSLTTEPAEQGAFDLGVSDGAD